METFQFVSEIARKTLETHNSLTIDMCSFYKPDTNFVHFEVDVEESESRCELGTMEF